MPGWLLTAEAVALGLLLALAVPVWALVPMEFGVTEHTPRAEARRVYALLLLFPVVAVGGVVGAFLLDPADPLRWALAALPAAHLLLLYLARARS